METASPADTTSLADAARAQNETCADGGPRPKRTHRARGQNRALRQTVIVLRAGTTLREHQSSREATLQVRGGRIRLPAGTQT
jgi:quercetin dioxygenase-like cupin family protein